MFIRSLRVLLPAAVGLGIATTVLPASAGGPTYSLTAAPTSGVPGAAIVLTATPGSSGACTVTGYNVTATYVGATSLTKSFTGTVSPTTGPVTINVIVPTDASPGTTLLPGQVGYSGQLTCSNSLGGFTDTATVRVLAPSPSPSPTASQTPAPSRSPAPAKAAIPVKRTANFTG